MITACFLKRKTAFVGFDVAGHADDSPSGESIVCAAVSSAIYMVANTVTDVLCVSADVVCEDGRLKLVVCDKHKEKCASLFKGLNLHLENLRCQYPKDIDIKYLEV